MITCTFENGNNAQPGLRHLVVGVILVKDNQILLLKRGTHNGKPITESGKWGYPVGFVDRDEHILETVARETKEETGWDITNVKLFRIVDNPDRPNDLGRQNINMVFLADAVEHSDVATEEVLEMKWFSINDLPPSDLIAFDFAEDINLYKKFLKENFPIPVLEYL